MSWDDFKESKEASDLEEVTTDWTEAVEGKEAFEGKEDVDWRQAVEGKEDIEGKEAVGWKKAPAEDWRQAGEYKEAVEGKEAVDLAEVPTDWKEAVSWETDDSKG